MTTLLMRISLVRDQRRRLCVCCRMRPASRPRGLCWGCYNRPGVREACSPASKYGNRGIGNGNCRGKLPDAPTNAVPGSEAKLRVLEERAARGERLDHPDDRRFADEDSLDELAIMRRLRKPRARVPLQREQSGRQPRVYRCCVEA